MPKNTVNTNIKSIEIQTRKKALDMLARREHATKEIREKLLGKGIAPRLVDDTLEKLVAEGLLSDRRFVEAYLQSRRNRGYGPLRIQAELRLRGIDDELIDGYINLHDKQWSDSIRNVWHKRFADHIPADVKERARQMRFLQYRGFTNEQISRLFKHVEY